jgi:hypothetical protein
MYIGRTTIAGHVLFSNRTSLKRTWNVSGVERGMKIWDQKGASRWRRLRIIALPDGSCCSDVAAALSKTLLSLLFNNTSSSSHTSWNVHGAGYYFSSCNCIHGWDLIKKVLVGTTDANSNSIDQEVMERLEELNHIISVPLPCFIPKLFWGA